MIGLAGPGSGKSWHMNVFHTFPCFVNLSTIVNPIVSTLSSCSWTFDKNLIKPWEPSDFDPGTVAALKELIHQRSKFPLEQMVLLLGCRTLCGRLVQWCPTCVQRLQRLRPLWISFTYLRVYWTWRVVFKASNKVWISSCPWSIKSECNTSFFLQQHSHVQAKRLGEDSAGKSHLFWMQASLNQMTSCNSCI